MPLALRVRIFWRLAVAHTPRTASGSFGPVGSAWSLVSCWSGTWMAIEFVLNPPTPSTPGCGRQRDGVEGVERSEPGQIEDRAEVDEEGVVALAGEELGAVAERLDRARPRGRRSPASSAARC